MALVQQYTVAPGFNPDRVIPAVNNEYFSVPISRTTIGVWSFEKLELRHKPLELQGHRNTIGALAFGNSGTSNLLCSCASDYVIVWNIEACRRNFEKRLQIKGEIIGTSLGEASSCAFNSDDTLVAVCVDVNVYVLKSNTPSIMAVLDGHLSRVTGAEFCPHYSSTVVTISDDRTFKIWDIDSHSLVYQSCVVTSSTLVNICMNWTKPAFSIGAADGIIRTYDLTDGNDFRILHQIDVGKITQKQRSSAALEESRNTTQGSKMISSRKTWNKPDPFSPRSVNYKDDGDKSSSAIVGISYAYSSSSSSSQTNEDVPSFLRSAVTDIVNDRSTILLVATTTALLQIDPQTLEALDFVDLQTEIQCNNNFASWGFSLKALNYASFTYGSNVCIVAGTLFENRIHVLDWGLALNDATSPIEDNSAKNVDAAFDLLSLCPDLNPDRERITRTTELCMVATNPLCQNSILAAKLAPQVKNGQKSATMNKRKVSNLTTKTSDSLNQPITFKNKVKSSGYSTQLPKGKLFTGKSKPVLKKSLSLDATLLREDYPTNCGPPNTPVTSRVICENSSPVLSARFSSNGHQIACSMANKLAINLSMPLKKDGSVLQSHDGPVNSVYWSHDNSLLVTASDDKSAIVWTSNSAEPIMKLSNHSDNMNGSGSPANSPFTKEVRQAQFYYMDKFILLITGSSFNMYKYYLDTSKHEVRRYMTKSKYKLVKSWTSESLNLTAMSAVNSFYSHVAICAGSNRSFEVYDMNVGKSVALVEDAHSRPIHAIALNEGSAYVSQPDVAYNVFATAAVADCIRLWDLRTKKCVQRFEGHVNKAIPCGLAISPCGQYLASGSEDKLTYIFDIRTGTYCERLKGHSDVVSCVAFHPSKPLMASGSLDGNLVLYKPESWHK